MAESRPLRIGQLAKQLSLNPKTIRYYERVGLLPTPQRTPAGYRVYGMEDTSRLTFILKAKHIGLSLEEIREILTLRDQGQPPCNYVLELAESKVAAIDKQIRVLQEIRAELTSLKVSAEKVNRRQSTVCSLIEEQ